MKSSSFVSFLIVCIYVAGQCLQEDTATRVDQTMVGYALIFTQLSLTPVIAPSFSRGDGGAVDTQTCKSG